MTLLAAVKSEGKALNIIKYIALGLGVVETVLEDKDKKGAGEPPPDHMLSNQENEVQDEME